MLRLKQRQLFMSMTTWQDHLEALIGSTVPLSPFRLYLSGGVEEFQHNFCISLSVG